MLCVVGGCGFEKNLKKVIAQEDNGTPENGDSGIMFCVKQVHWELRHYISVKKLKQAVWAFCICISHVPLCAVASNSAWQQSCHV